MRLWVCFWSGTWKRIPVDEWTLKIMTVLAYVCVFERVRARRPACVCAQVGCYSYRLLIDPDTLAGSGGVQGSDGLRQRAPRPGWVNAGSARARTRPECGFTQEKKEHKYRRFATETVANGKIENVGVLALLCVADLTLSLRSLEVIRFIFFLFWPKWARCPLSPQKKRKKKYRKPVQIDLRLKGLAWLFSQGI